MPTQFYDIIGANAGRAPHAKGTLVAYYNTGTGGVPATAAQIAAAKAAGMGVALIDQWHGDTGFAQGLSDILDVENGAATTADAVSGVKARQVHGWKSTIYCSYSALPALKAAIEAAGCNMALVFFGVADYSWSIAEAETLLAQNPGWAYCQYGDNLSNATTLIPGTNVTCGQAACDIDVAQDWWAAQFIPGSTTPPAPPKAPAPPASTTWEVPMSSLPEIAAGSTNANVVRTVQGLCGARGHATTIDGDWGPNTTAAVRAVQTAARISVDGICGPQTWGALLAV